MPPGERTLKVEYERLLRRRGVDGHCQLARELPAVRLAEDVEGDGAEGGMGVEELAEEVDEVDGHSRVRCGEEGIVVHVRET